MDAITLKTITEGTWLVYHSHRPIATARLTFERWKGENIVTLQLDTVEKQLVSCILNACVAEIYDCLGQNDISYISQSVLDDKAFDRVECEGNRYRYIVYYVSLHHLEQVKATPTIPWDYDIYAICVNHEEVGRLVYRDGSDHDLRYCGHVGYEIDPDHRGHRYSYAAIQVLLKQLKGKKSHLILTCDKYNGASKKIIESLHPSRHRQEAVHDGEYETLEIYEVTL